MKNSNGGGYIEFPSIREAVCHVFDKMAVGTEFTGWQLKEAVQKLNPDYRGTFPDTILRRLREHRRWSFIACDPLKSKYRKIREVKPKMYWTGVELRHTVKAGLV